MKALDTIQPFIDHLDNVYVFKAGKIHIQKLKAPFDQIKVGSFDDLTEAALKALKNTILKDYEGIDEALNASTYTTFIQVPKGFESDEKLYIFFLDGNHTEHIHLNLGSSSKLNVFEYHLDDVAGSKNILETITLGAYAHLDMASLSAYHEGSKVTFNRQGFFQEKSEATLTLASLGDETLIQNTHLKLLGFQAKTELTAIAMTSKKQISTIKSTIEHNAIESEGELNHYGVANDESFLTFEGMGKIEKGMRQSKNHQHNKGVVLAPKARLDANPLLVIDEFDVEAGHGAAVGRIDEEQLYYMMSRGMDKKTSERLIVNGFLHPLDRYLSEDFKTHVQNLLIQKTQ